VSGKHLAPPPPQEQPGDPLDHGHRGPEHEVEKAERTGKLHAEAVRKSAENHFGEQIEQRVEQERRQGIHPHKPPRVPAQRRMQNHHQGPEDNEVGERVAHQDGPQEALGLLEEPEQHTGRSPAGAGLLVDAEPAQRKDARFHSGKEKRQNEARNEQEGHGNRCGRVVI